MIFKITNVKRWPHLNVALVDGLLISGHIKTGNVVTLVHEGEEFPLKITGIVLPSHTGALTLNVDINQKAVELVKAGDHLAGA